MDKLAFSGSNKGKCFRNVKCDGWAEIGRRLRRSTETESEREHCTRGVHGQCYFSCDFLVTVIVKVIIFQVFQLQF